MKTRNTSVSKWVSEFVRGKMEKEEEIIKLLEENKVLQAANKRLKMENETVFRFRIPCSVCGRDIIVTSLDESWNSYVYPRLKEAFKYSRHNSCANKF